jgi:hypothetical protein
VGVKFEIYFLKAPAANRFTCFNRRTETPLADGPDGFVTKSFIALYFVNIYIFDCTFGRNDKP